MRVKGIAAKTPLTFADRLSGFISVNPFFSFTTVYNPVDGMYYIGAMGRTNKKKDPYIFKFDPVKNAVVQEKRLVFAIVPAIDATDSHRVPTTAVGVDGKIYVCAEELKPFDDAGHCSPVRIYGTSTAGDLTTLALINTITNRWSYPLIHINGNDLYVFMRGTNSDTEFIRGQYWFVKSTDLGVSFGAKTKIYDSGNEQIVAYFQRVQDHTGGITLVYNERNNDTFNYTGLCALKFDGVSTFSNASGSFSKNVAVSGAITRAEMFANFKVFETSTPLTQAVNYEGGIVKSDGSIKLCVSIQTLTGNVYGETGIQESTFDELRFYTFSAGVWSYNLVDAPVGFDFYWGADKPCQYLNNDESFDDILFIDFGGDRDVIKMRSNDNFATQTNEVIYAGETGLQMGQCAFNVEDEDDYFATIIKANGNYLEAYLTETSADYNDLLFLKLANL